MEFPDDEVRLRSGRISNAERFQILEEMGRIAQEKYDEYVVQGGNAYGYDLRKLKGSLQFEPNVQSFENQYYLEGQDEKWTDIAGYFEYGTGLFNTKRSGKYRAGYIRPIVADYMRFVSKSGNWVTTKKVKGVRPIFAMQKAVKYVEFNRERIQRSIRQRLQQYD